ncbi:MAG: Crp/Fnr family transcriptional regulator [Candidatus Rokuibacteriota bacterium]
MNIPLADYLVHLSNVMLLVSYSVRDILWLRWFAVAAAFVNIPYFLLQGTVLWPPVLWAGVFIAINLFQITRIYLDRRPIVLSEDEQKLYDLGFRSLRPREFVALALVGEWKSAAAGERMLTEGEPVSALCIAIAGSAEVRKQTERIGSLEPGHIIGTALALTGDPSPVDVVCTEPARYMRWSLPSLRTFMDKRPDLRVALQSLVNRDLASKLEALLSRRAS